MAGRIRSAVRRLPTLVLGLASTVNFVVTMENRKSMVTCIS